MRFITIRPSPLLADYVRCFWMLEASVSGAGLYVHRNMASGCPELFFHYKGDFEEVLPGNKTEKCFSSGIHGQSQVFRRFRTGEDFGIFGAYLYPFAVPLLLGIPAEEVSNHLIDFQTFLGTQGEMLEEKIMLAKDTTERVSILSDFLIHRLPGAGSSPVIPVIRHIIHANGNTPIQLLSDQCFLSTRQFERVFKHYSGFRPKLFSRLIRFESTTSQYVHKGKSLTEIAYDCGYYDQSHFIHEFKEFSGHDPRHFFSGKAEGTQWRE